MSYNYENQAPIENIPRNAPQQPPQNPPIATAQMLFPIKTLGYAPKPQTGILHQLLTQDRGASTSNQGPRPLNRRPNVVQQQGRQGHPMTVGQLAHQNTGIPVARRPITSRFNAPRANLYSRPSAPAAPIKRPVPPPINIRAQPVQPVQPVAEVVEVVEAVEAPPQPAPLPTPPLTPIYSDPSILESNDEFFVKQIGKVQITVIRAKDRSNAIYPMFHAF